MMRTFIRRTGTLKTEEAEGEACLSEKEAVHRDLLREADSRRLFRDPARSIHLGLFL